MCSGISIYFKRIDQAQSRLMNTKHATFESFSVTETEQKINIHGYNETQPRESYRAPFFAAFSLPCAGGSSLAETCPF